MKNKMIKYEDDFFKKIMNKIKNMFCKKSTMDDNENMNESITKVEKDISMYSQFEIMQLVGKYDNNEVNEEEISNLEAELIEKYYINLLKNLDKEISAKSKLLNDLKHEQDYYYEEARKLNQG